MRHFKIAVAAGILARTISSRLAAVTDPQVGAHLHLSKHDVTLLLKTAHTAEEFRFLSRYYTEQRQHLERRAREHQEEAEGYASRKVFEPKTGIPGGLLAHCRYFAWYYNEKANQAKTLATHYEELAKTVQDLDQPQRRKEKE